MLSSRTFVAIALLTACKSTLPPAPRPPATVCESCEYRVGDRVDGQWTNGSWYPGQVAALNADGTYRVQFDDGDVSESLTSAQLRKSGAVAAAPAAEPAKAPQGDQEILCAIAEEAIAAAAQNFEPVKGPLLHSMSSGTKTFTSSSKVKPEGLLCVVSWFNLRGNVFGGNEYTCVLASDLDRPTAAQALASAAQYVGSCKLPTGWTPEQEADGVIRWAQPSAAAKTLAMRVIAESSEEEPDKYTVFLKLGGK